MTLDIFISRGILRLLKSDTIETCWFEKQVKHEKYSEYRSLSMETCPCGLEQS
jgi:hypothetical protein